MLEVRQLTTETFLYKYDILYSVQDIFYPIKRNLGVDSIKRS